MSVTGRYDVSSLRALKIKLSESQVSGLGVFALLPIEQGTNIAFIPLTYATVESTTQHANYTFEMPATYQGCVLDTFNVAQTNFVRFINSCHNTNQPQNVEILWYGPIPVLQATRNIQHGQELLLDYDV